MDALPGYMFDTNVFNRILDGVISIQTLTGRVVVYATHIQRDEIDNTKNPERRAALAQVFGDVVAELPPTDSFVLGVSRLDEARLGGERVVPTASAVYGVSRYGQAKYSAEDNLFSALKDRLDSINRNKPNNVHDALIAETSIKEGHILVTDDTDLAAVTKEYGGQCLSVGELLRRYT
jgi:predicted nucleic acid-binding protein